MAVRYAVATGNWSDTATWNGGTLPTSADDVYSNGFTVTIDVDVTVLSLRNEVTTGVLAGGGYVLNDDVTINCTGLGIRNAGTTCVTFSSNGTSYINSNITNNGQSPCVNVTSTGELYIVGEITSTGGNGVATINATAACKIYITGDVFTYAFSGAACIMSQNHSTFYITGNVSTAASGNANHTIRALNNSNIYITGNLFYQTNNGNQGLIITNNTLHYINIVGSINASAFGASQTPCVSSGGGRCLFTGPFISSINGVMPFSAVKVFLIPIANSFLEFRDSSTNGEFIPAAPPIRLIGDDNFPIISDVREGISYASNTFTGTLKVPPPDTVAKGVPTDNTVGTAMLKPEDVWNYATANLTDPDSIGARLKNVSTVDTTGEQLEALL
jgi:hypothetical protein